VAPGEFPLAWSARDILAREAYAKLDEVNIPHYKSPVRCGRALAALSWYAQALRRGEAQRAEKPLAISGSAARKLLNGKRDDLCEYAAKQVLREYGIGITAEELATSQGSAVAIAQRIGYPVVLKVQSPDISHKTEAKAVRLEIVDEAALKTAYDEVLSVPTENSPEPFVSACPTLRQWPLAGSRSR